MKRHSTISAKHVNLMDRVVPAPTHPVPPAMYLTITKGRKAAGSLWDKAVYVRNAR